MNQNNNQYLQNYVPVKKKNLSNKSCIVQEKLSYGDDKYYG